MRVTVVIPIWNMSVKVRDMAERCVLNFIKNTPSCPVICVDNASTYPIRIPKEYGVKEIVWDKNKGISAAWNAGAKAAKDGIVVFANSDAFVKPGWLAPLVKLLRDETRAVAGCTEVTGDQYEKFMRRPEKISTAKISGACFAMRKRTLQKVGWFDENISPAYFEDIDMWMRLITRGFGAAASSHSCMEHIRMASCRQAKNWNAIWLRNLDYFKKKHGLRNWSPGSGWMGCLRSIHERELRGSNPLVESQLARV